MLGAGTDFQDLVLVGGGHSHVQVLRAFGMQPQAGVRITLVSPQVQTPYSGMLPGHIAGQYDFDDIHIDLAPLARFAGARLLRATAIGIEPDQRLLRLRDRPPLHYDLLSINSGSTPVLPRAPDERACGVAVKPINGFLSHWQAALERFAQRDAPREIAVIGGGAGGVELALAVEQALRARAAGDGGPGFRITLYTATPDILPGYPPRVAVQVRAVLAQRGIGLHTDARVTPIAPGLLRDPAGREFACHEAFWVTDAGAPDWLRGAGLAVDARGFMLVDDRLRSVSHPAIFGAGDVVALRDTPRPKAGVFAVRQGPLLADNLRRALQGQALRRYRPQTRYLSILNLGAGQAIAARGAWSAQGAWVWRWKDRIDRRFMQRFRDLPAMRPPPAAPAPAPGAAPRCGGCGAKVGAEVLAQVLRQLPVTARPDVIAGLDAPDDAAVLAVPPGAQVAVSVDAFRPMLDDPWLFGRIAAVHGLADLHAMGARAQAALAIVTLPAASPRQLADELLQLLDGALQVFAAEQVALVGGHTAEGAELSLGFAVTGLLAPGELLRKTGLAEGDCLLLTKALGTGIVFAADMQAGARGRIIDGALASMLQSSRAAAELLRAHGARACTDVSGFGLLGHLHEMLGAELGADLDIARLPALDGAAELVARGFRSTLAPHNERILARVSATPAARGHRHFPLLCDPQTAGGLLAGVPADRAAACVAALRQAGYPASAIIGRVRAGAGIALAADDTSA